MKSAALLSPELVAAPEGFARLRGAALPDAGRGRGPPQGFAGVLEAASRGRLPDGDGLPVGGKRLPPKTAQPLAPDARFAAWLAAVDASAFGVAGTAAAAAAAAAQAGALGAGAAEASAAGLAQAPLPAAFSAGGNLDGETLAQAGLPAETLGARAAAADGAALARRGPAVFMLPAGAQAALAPGSAPGDASTSALGGAQTAVATASVAAGLVDAAAVLRGDSPGAAQAASAAPFAASVLRAAEPAAGFAFDAAGVARGAAAAATLPPHDAGVPGSGAMPAADAALAAPAQAGALLERAVRAQAEAAGGEPGDIVAQRLGAERALADAMRRAGGPAETTSASGSGVVTPQIAAPAAAAAAPAGAPPAAEPFAAHGNAHALDLDDAAWNEQLMGRIRWLVDRDVGEARIKLHPADLGSLDVKIAVRDEQTFVQLAASSAAARDELEQSLPRLRELLGQMGLTLAGATVSGGREEHAAYSAHGGRLPYAPDAAGVMEEEPAALPRPPRAADGRIDLYA